MVDPTPIGQQPRRLKSLDEFEPLPWHKPARVSFTARSLLIAVALGALAGWLLAGRF